MNTLSGFAHLDFDREERCGFPEVVYGAGKTPEQVSAIMCALVDVHKVVLCTRASAEQAAAVKRVLPDAQFVSSCGVLYADRRGGSIAMQGELSSDALDGELGDKVLRSKDETLLSGDEGQSSAPSLGETESTPPLAEKGVPIARLSGQVVVCCAGTSDLAVAEEAALTARIMGSHVTLLTDIGISGVHRALQHTDVLHSARAIVAVAGMEGALPSLVAGLVDVPVVAVPTSIGYGASFGGLAALLGMLNSCANGVSVVNIDNGFGAGVIAHRINVPPERFLL
ncbi:MAG: nickel pincer cofactor biosynthesis protein LarB [Coriobacteriales bacterium]|jgi:NCAIR mutase (PurE)-related protein|nr:nickel pincer cofactor biosynthesis protein LarB [Coriobacteriales bacterium]